MHRAWSPLWLLVLGASGCNSANHGTDPDPDADGLAGAAGASGQSAATLADDHALTARGFAIEIPVLDNDRGVAADALVALVDPAHNGSASTRDGRIVEYSPGEAFVGVDGFSYRLEGVDEGRVARVSIDVVDREWLLLSGEPFAVERGPAPNPRLEPEAERWTFSDVSSTHIVGHAGPLGRERAFTWSVGQPAPTWLSETESRAHHTSESGVVTGALGPLLGGRGVVWQESESRQLHAQWAIWTELSAVDGDGAAIGSAGDAERTLPVRFRSETDVDWLELPPGFEQALALGANEAGTIVGAVLDGSAESAYVRRTAGAALLPLPHAVWSRANDVNAEETIVGTARGEGEFSHGFVVIDDAPPTPVELRGAVATELLGVSEAGVLAGSILDASGYWSGFVARSDAHSIGAGRRVYPAADGPNAAVSHACIHSTEGPFRVLNAAHPSSPPSFDQPHTSYTLQLAPEGRSRFLYRASEPGQVSLFVYPPATLRVHAPNGALLAPRLVRPVSSCPRIAFVYQLEIAEAGEHTLVVDENPRTTVYMILERTWAY